MKNNTTSNLSLASLMPQLATATPNQLCRHGVFETNSSSCHSLSLQLNQDGELETNPTLFSDFHIGEDGKLFFSTDEYGWEISELYSFYDKLSYVMTYCITTDSYEDFMFVLKVLHDVTQFQSLYYENFNLLVGTWDDDTDRVEFAHDSMVKFVFVDDLDIYSFFKRVNGETYSYIDHQSIDLLDDVIKDEYKLKNLLFCKQSYIQTDNDNH
jgi:hypothetical protein